MNGALNPTAKTSIPAATGVRHHNRWSGQLAITSQWTRSARMVSARNPSSASVLRPGSAFFEMPPKISPASGSRSFQRRTRVVRCQKRPRSSHPRNCVTGPVLPTRSNDQRDALQPTNADVTAQTTDESATDRPSGRDQITGPSATRVETEPTP